MIGSLFNLIREAVILLLHNFITWFSFNNEIESMVDTLTHKLDEPEQKIGTRLFSHPGGFIKDLGKRRMNIAQAYIKITRDHSPKDADERLTALKMLIEQSLHSKTLNMPLNTARVQINLMKEAVKAQGEKRRQMEAIADFGMASFGQETVIRSFLNKFHMIEVPEEDKQLKDLDLGWDDHVHDFLSEGRKTPTQVLLDAFVKGISRLTLVYSNIDEPLVIHEAITAGQLLGIKVQIGIEFSVGKGGNRRHYMYVPPNMGDSQSFFTFFADRHEVFASFLQGLKTNDENRRSSMATALERFNTIARLKLNDGYSPQSPCWLPPVTTAELDKIVICGQTNRVHLGEVLYSKMREIFHNRVLELKAQVSAAQDRFQRGVYSEWEMKNLLSQYQSVREQYETMNPWGLFSQFIEIGEVGDYDSDFTSEAPLLDQLIAQGGRVVWVHPLEIGLKEAMLNLLGNASRVSDLETLNLRDSAHRNPNDLIILNKLVYLLNNGTPEDLLRFFEQNGIPEATPELIQKALDQIRGRGMVPVCGSDSTGRDPDIPGMGFIKVASIPASIRCSFIESHYKLARPIGQLVITKGKNPPDKSAEDEGYQVICMGKIGKPIRNMVGDEPESGLVGLDSFWAYLNPGVKSFLRIAAGLAVAFSWMNYQFALVMGLTFAGLWFAITGLRNLFVDLIAASGSDFKSWTLRNVNWDNLSQSLFWTGFSVPILGMVKLVFDERWPLEKSGFVFEMVKFLFLCVANGIYISTHNRIRNFDRRVIRANFFRTLLAWPFATILSPIGNIIGIPSIVQAKFWSDVVAGIIEGSGKFNQRFVLRQRDLGELLPKLNSIDRETRLTAMLDILYIWGRQPRGKTCLRRLLLQIQSIHDWFRGTETPEEERKARVETFHAYYLKLKGQFDDPGCLVTLSEFILKNFKGREAVILTDLVGTRLEGFRHWLSELRKHFPA
ncbi:hypothetical protein AUK22_06795 [bacterium CG2_30_54_10]|nr:MAG: hypothetical protein AUK22_06795 [bacterium CG2_30_54_10]